ncbi:glycosyl hydrolase family 18 protein [Fangia hongkongensis]|uniref:glycosyl hydrolase family 18 protein n=1 Tax=Fangia hongkongensis TaxID=270495 RepID=UPI00036A08F3|nr:glycosyl hydrolase family 18 protein [Fangia hongkongensis]MBK2123700.1 hypothetical protein [Fangia hongkongensis]
MKRSNKLLSTAILLASAGVGAANCVLDNAQSGWTGKITFYCDAPTNLVDNPIKFDVSNDVKVTSIWGLSGNAKLVQNGSNVVVTVKKWWPDEPYIVPANQSVSMSFSPSNNQFEISNFSVGPVAPISKATINVKLPQKPAYIKDDKLANVVITSNGKMVAEVKNKAWGKPVHVPVSFSGDEASFNISVPGIDGGTGSATPQSFSLKSGGSQSVTIEYQAPKPVEKGSVVVMTSIKSASNEDINAPYQLTENGSVLKEGVLQVGRNDLGEFPISKSDVNYTLKTQSYTAKGINYTPSVGSQVVEVHANKVSHVKVDYTSRVIPTESVSINVAGLPEGATSQLSLTPEKGEKKTVNLTANKAYQLSIPQDNQKWSASASSYNNYVATLSPSSFTANKDNQTIAVNYQKQESSKQLSIFWCGFSGNYCGQSVDNDVYEKATIVILAFVNTHTDGSVDADTMPTQLINDWHRAGKKVLISVGGQNGHWEPIFKNPDNFVNSITKIVSDNNLDGVDLDIEGYTTAPKIVSETISKLRATLGQDKLIVVSPENVTVYPQQGIPVPRPDQGGSPWNYFVPILQSSLSQINYVQPQMYNNGYLGSIPATSDFLITNYLGWMNHLPYKIANFNGVPANKLIMGVLASPVAGISSFYTPPDQLKEAIATLESKYNISVGGVMMWDSNWDAKNSNAISKAAAEALKL